MSGIYFGISELLQTPFDLNMSTEISTFDKKIRLARKTEPFKRPTYFGEPQMNIRLKEFVSEIKRLPLELISRRLSELEDLANPAGLPRIERNACP
jgi:hypothetical protein